MNYATFNKFYFFILVFSVSFTEAVADKPILIMTHSYNRPDFIEIQYKTFKAFLTDPYEFVVFNDAPDSATCNKIDDTCMKYGIRSIRIPQSIHRAPYLFRLPGEDYNHPCVRCANVVQYSLDTVGFKHDGLVMIIDSDMFLIEQFSLQEYLSNYDLAGVPQSRQHVNYLWNGLLFFNMNSLPDKTSLNFNCGQVDGIPVDVGGHTYDYLSTHPETRVKLIGHMLIPEGYVLFEEEGMPKNVRFLLEQGMCNIEFLIRYTFLHYRSGANWDYKPLQYHQTKTQILESFIKSILPQD